DGVAVVHDGDRQGRVVGEARRRRDRRYLARRDGHLGDRLAAGVAHEEGLAVWRDVDAVGIRADRDGLAVGPGPQVEDGNLVPQRDGEVRGGGRRVDDDAGEGVR